ncbi:unnamed protein product, partial [Tetraodon nigroviridis]
MSDQLGCTRCRESLCGRRYIRAEDGPHCVSCYERRFANTCRECEELIGHDAEELFFQDGYYHAACLRCSRCRRSLAQQPFSSRGGALVCGDCCGSHFSSRCSACRGAATPGSRMLEYGGSTWHEGCFTCQACGEPMGTEAFVPHQDSFYCLPCYQRRLAPQCRHCKKALTKGGVAYREEVWHKECFLCSGCSSPLAGQPFTSQGDTPYCIRCFSSLYAKKCAGCNTAITGFGDGKYVSFEERQWHQPCFKCWRCSVSLVGSAFFPDRGHILCSDCN